MTDGLYLAFEGGEGTGKTTQIAYLKDELGDRGYTVHTTREPGGTALGNTIRGLLLGKEGPKFCDATEMLLFFLARTELNHSVIQPALTRGEMVLADRSFYSSWAYQVCTRGVDPDFFRGQFAGGYIAIPDLTIILDIEPKEGLRRVGARGLLDRIDAEKLPFHQTVRQAFLELPQNFPGRKFITIDATPPKEEVYSAIMEAVNPYLPQP